MSLLERVLTEIDNLDLPEGERREAIKQLSVQLAGQVVPSTEENTGLYRTVLQVEVLHDSVKSFDGWSLADIENSFMEGESSGTWDIVAYNQVSREDMAQLAVAQGSDPGFFGLDDEES